MHGVHLRQQSQVAIHENRQGSIRHRHDQQRFLIPAPIAFCLFHDEICTGRRCLKPAGLETDRKRIHLHQSHEGVMHCLTSIEGTTAHPDTWKRESRSVKRRMKIIHSRPNYSLIGGSCHERCSGPRTFDRYPKSKVCERLRRP